jgi:hypothetical protein
MKNSKITKAELIEDCGSYYLSLEYLLEDDNRIEKLTIPRVMLPVDGSFYPGFESSLDYDFWDPRKIELKASYSGVSLRVLKDSDGNYYTYETIKEKEHEMTIEEIEKKLGYKVKIVSGDKKKNEKR